MPAGNGLELKHAKLCFTCINNNNNAGHSSIMQSSRLTFESKNQTLNYLKTEVGL